MKSSSILLLLALVSCSCATTSPTQAKIFQPIVAKDEPKDPEEIIGEPVLISPRETDAGFRHLKLVDSVDSDSVKPLIEELKNGKGFKGFILELNTPGGEVYSGFLLTKAIEEAGVPVHCLVDGKAMSMGYYLLQSCTTRNMTKRSVLMIHGPSMSGSIDGNTNELQELTDNLSSLNKAMIEHCVARMKISRKELADRISTRAWFLNWEEALKVGAVDKIVKDYAEELDLAKSYKPSK